jgi:hypothetical protein
METNDASVKDEFFQALGDFYHSYIVETAHGSFQVFQSFTYGEMVISFLLTCILFAFLLKWFYEVIR